jgi:hypothetical protein
VSVKQKESNQNLDHKLKPENTKPKKKREFHTHQIRNEQFVAVFTLPETVEETQIVCSACGGGLLQNTYQQSAFLRKRREQSAADRCDCLGEEDEAVVPLNVPCHVL